MDFAAAEHFDNCMADAAGFDHPAADLQADFTDNPQDISFGDRRLRPHHKVRTAEGVEVGGVIGEIKPHVQEFPQLFGGRWRIDPVDGVAGFGGRHVVGFRADPADPIG